EPGKDRGYGEIMPKTFLKFLESYERELLKKGEGKKDLIITVSGMSGSGKSMIVRFILERIKLRHFSGGRVVREFASKKGISLEEFSKARDKGFDYMLEKRILREGLKGNIIIDARLAGWVLGEWAGLRIFVGSSLEKRAERVAKRDGISRDEAFKKLQERDMVDKQRYRELYGIDLSDMSIYHRVIDNSGSLDELRKNALDAVRILKNNS
ncbi:MAG: cytidylate kinase family protein, partial [Candidatus Aenigmatarchaeota archaeon]